MEVESEVIVALVPVCCRLPATVNGRAHEASNCTRNWIPASINARDGIYVPIIAAIRCNCIAGDLNECRFWRWRLCPVGCHVDPEFVTIEFAGPKLAPQPIRQSARVFLAA